MGGCSDNDRINWIGRAVNIPNLERDTKRSVRQTWPMIPSANHPFFVLMNCLKGSSM